MNNIEIIYYVRDAVACLGVLVGLGGAVFLFIRKKTLPAILALIGFILLGIEPSLDVILWRVLANNSNANYDTLNYAYACITGPALFLGILLIVLVFILGFRETKLPPPPMEPPVDLPPAT
ncbi:MAG: hypothetical protein ABSG01_05210 [Anaerolineales bacterium]|jgi:hypothetical protein